MLVPLAVFLSACAGEPEGCETACGIVLHGSDDCAGLRTAEHRLLEAFADVYAPREMCQALEDVEVSVFPAAAMPRVQGLTQGNSVQLSDESIALNGWAYGLAHEAGGHVFDRELAGVSDPEHKTWADRGIWDAVSKVVQRP